jgi:hypothetical protein
MHGLGELLSLPGKLADLGDGVLGGIGEGRWRDDAGGGDQTGERTGKPSVSIGVGETVAAKFHDCGIL